MPTRVVARVMPFHLAPLARATPAAAQGVPRPPIGLSYVVVGNSVPKPIPSTWIDTLVIAASNPSECCAYPVGLDHIVLRP